MVSWPAQAHSVELLMPFVSSPSLVTSRFKFDDRESCHDVADHAASMSSSGRIFKEQRVAGPDGLALSVRCFEFHFSVENEDSHAQR